MSTSRPATPEEKLFIRQQQAREFGKEFDEAKERRILGLPPVPNPVYIEESPQRRRLVRAEDAAHAREFRQMQEAAEKAARADLEQQVEEQNREIEQLKAQIAQLMGERDEPKPAAPTPATVDDPAKLVGPPTEAWTVKQLIAYLEQEGLELPERRGQKMTKMQVFQWTMDRYNEREEAAARMAETEGDEEGGDDELQPA